jgi:antitoxin (DNA-binding transcriptional repressor) of toxin-antitoxin stability system
MKEVAVREFENRLSAYLRDVAAGESVLVSDRGQVVAESRRPTVGAPRSPSEMAVQRLVDGGLPTLRLPQDRAAYQAPAVRSERDVQELLDEERAER